MSFWKTPRGANGDAVRRTHLVDLLLGVCEQVGEVREHVAVEHHLRLLVRAGHDVPHRPEGRRLQGAPGATEHKKGASAVRRRYVGSLCGRNATSDTSLMNHNKRKGKIIGTPAKHQACGSVFIYQNKERQQERKSRERTVQTFTLWTGSLHAPA